MMGSSPLTRGIHPDAILCTNVQRFIPAHAGNTAASSLLLAATKVHPRSRGEYTKKSLILSHFFQHPFSHFI